MPRHRFEVFFASKTKSIKCGAKHTTKICNSFEQRFEGLEDDELVNETATRSDTILYHTCKCMNTKS